MKIIIKKSGKWAVRSKGILNLTEGQEINLPPYDAAQLMKAGRAEIFKAEDKNVGQVQEQGKEAKESTLFPGYDIERRKQGWWTVNGLSVRGTDEETAIANYKAKQAE